jgi:uncharacterized membrane protein
MGTPVLRKRLRDLYKPERLLALSDGVIAVAITLLVLDLKVPPAAGRLDDAALLHELSEMLPSFAMYALSFLAVGLAWIGHHRKFTHIHRVDGLLIWLNLLFLMAVALVPFVTAVLSQSKTQTAMILYSGTLGLTMALSAAMSAYAMGRPELIDAGMSASLRRSLVLSPAFSAGAFVVSLLAALFDPTLSRYALLLLVPAALFPGAREPSPPSA